MHDELRRIHREIASTFILVTHDQGEAITLSDRIAVMDQGRIAQLGTPNDIYHRPQTRFVASFIGHANFIDGTVIALREGRCELDAAGLRLEGRPSGSLQIGVKATGMLRYEHVRFEPQTSDRGLSVTVEDISFQGSTCRVIAKLGNGARLISERAADTPLVPFSPGDRARVVWNADNLAILPD
jgi:ABC-type Fe3+/spermidine/putrescine transport system ATPase subunit